MIYPRATTEFIYRYNSPDIAQVYLSFKLATVAREQEVSEVLATLEKQGMKGYDISDDEMAKSHSRYMIAGAHKVENERLFRFGMSPRSTGLRPVSGKRHSLQGANSLIASIEFPERPGALRKFLLGMQTKWNISLFHYRNHGAGKRKSASVYPGTPLFLPTPRVFQILGRFLLGFKCHRKIMPNSITS